MLKNYPFLKIFSLLALGAMMAACDSGGVGTSANPNLSGNGGNKFVYTGPPARDIEVSNFQFYLWKNVVDPTRCGGCHNSEASTPVTPLFFDTSNVNVAYDAAVAKDPALLDMSTINPLDAVFVDKLENTHFCWETNTLICAALLAGWIDDWKNAANGGVGSRQINLTAPANIRDPGDSKSFPPSHDVPAGTSFEETVYPLLVANTPFAFIANDNCQNCHEEIATPLPQAPFFASGDVAAAYEAAKSKMDIDSPANSRFVQRLIEQHNCWSDCGTTPNDIGSDANDMLQVITAFANGISATQIDPTLVISKALTLGEGIVASGGNRHETDQFALWEFKTGSGLTAFDTSGVGDSINLSMIGSVNWVGGYGLEFTGGRAQADTISSDKIFTYLQDTREYAIEAWVIPSNVTQEDANIASYSGGDLSRNFTLGQDMYSYESYNRVDSIASNANGDPVLSTGEDNEELAQASLQHVVINYDPLDRLGTGAGRSIYVNGQRVNNLNDTVAGDTIAGIWDDSFAFILGNEISGNRPWMGQIKLVGLHSRALDQAQILQNFDVGVGQKFFLLFYVGHHLGEIGNPNSFIMFEVAQFDSYSYLFNKPIFVTLDGSAPIADISIKGLRIGINGKEALAGQAYANLDTTVTVTGQELSPKGTIITLEKGPDSDEFFLTFEDFNGITKTFTDTVPTVAADPSDPASPVESDIGMRTFEEIAATISSITGIPVNDTRTFNGNLVSVKSTYDNYIQQLPSVEAIGAFLPSHQMAIAQLALASCNTLVEANPGYFTGFNMNQDSRTAFGEPPTALYYSPAEPAMGTPLTVQQTDNRNAIIDPLLTAAMNVISDLSPDNLETQPDASEIRGLLGDENRQNLGVLPNNQDEYDSLISQMLGCKIKPPPLPQTCAAPTSSIQETKQIAKAVCATAVGSAAMLVQ